MPTQSGPELLVESAKHIIHDLVWGDRRLHRLSTRAALAASMDRPFGLSPAPQTLMATRMRAYLRYVYVHESEDSFFFGLLGSGTFERKMADIRVGFAVEPTLQRASAPVGEPGFSVALPAFLETVEAGRQFRVRLPGTDPLVVTPTAGSIAVSHQGRRLEPDDLDWSLSHALVMTLAAWLKDRGDASPRPIARTVGDRLDGLLVTVAKSFSGLIGILEQPIGHYLPTPVGDLADLFGDSYRLSEAMARFLVNLDADGRLVFDPDDERERQQFDIEARLSRFGDPLGIDLRLWIPDFLASNHRYHRRFFDKLTQGEGVEELFEELKNKPFLTSEAELRQFLAEPEVEHRSAILRVVKGKAGGEEEHDVVALEGPMGGRRLRLLLLVRFEVSSWPDVRVTGVEDVDLLAWQQDQSRWQPNSDKKHLAKYLHRILRILSGWWVRAEAARP